MSFQATDSDVAQAEELVPILAGRDYPLWSPDRAYVAAAVLLGMLEAERTEP